MDLFDRYQFLDDDKLMVVPDYVTGTTLDGTKRYIWKAVHGRGICARHVTVLPCKEASALAAHLTERNEPF